MSSRFLETLPLPGLVALPSQPFGPLHLVPLVRSSPIRDLPLVPGARSIEHVEDGVALAPHGMVVGFEDAMPKVAYGTQLVSVRHGTERAMRSAPMSFPIGRRDAVARARMLPMHLTLEGLLLASFDARPETWTRRSRLRVFDPSTRAERSAASVIESALRTFELEAHQCGALLYAADTLLAAFVAPSPEVWSDLHRAVVGDLLGATLQFHITRHDAADRPFTLELQGAAIRTLDDLRLALSHARAPWPTAARALVEGIAPSAIVVRASTRVAPFTVRRFTTTFGRSVSNGVGEVVTRDDGATAWLSYLRLSDAQSRRAFLLSELALSGWSVATLAARTGKSSVGDTEKRLANADLEHAVSVMSPARPRR